MMTPAPRCHCRNRTCQECRDAADDMAAADLADLYVRHSVTVHRHLAVVLCGGCEQPIDAIEDALATTESEAAHIGASEDIHWIQSTAEGSPTITTTTTTNQPKETQ